MHTRTEQRQDPGTWGALVEGLSGRHHAATLPDVPTGRGLTSGEHPATWWDGRATVEVDGARQVHTCDVAIADPDDVSALLTAEVLGGAGHRVKILELEQLLTGPHIAPVLLLADPTAHGPLEAALSALRRQRDGAHPAVVALTFSRDPNVAAGLLDAGADLILTRPWGPLTLRSNIAAQLRRHLLTCGGAPIATAVP